MIEAENAYTQTSHFICPECGEFRVLTYENALVCPNAHGKVGVGVDRRMWNNAHRRYLNERWLETLPLAAKTKRVFVIEGLPGTYRKAVRLVFTKFNRSKGTSIVKRGQVVDDQLVVARVRHGIGWKAYSFRRAQP